MHEDLNQFVKNYVWFLVPKPTVSNIIGTKGKSKNKSDENSIVVRNKGWLIA